LRGHTLVSSFLYLKGSSVFTAGQVTDLMDTFYIVKEGAINKYGIKGMIVIKGGLVGEDNLKHVCS